MIHSIDCAQLIDALKVNIVWKDLRSHYIGANQHFLEVVGLTAETLSGKTDYDLTTHDLAKKIIENDQEVFAKRETLSFHEHIIDSEGNTKIYLSYKTPLFDQNNELFGLTTLAIDVTEVNRKESQLISDAKAKSTYIDSMRYFDQIATMFNLMASNIPANIFWMDYTGRYLGCNFANKQIADAFGPFNIIGKTIHELSMPKEIADKVAQIDRQVMTEGKAITLEEEGIDQHGNPATYITNKAPVHNDKGDVIGMLGISLDISEQKRLEQSLREAKEKAEEADRAKASFIMNISHDIRTPFMGILGFSEMLEAQEQDPFKKETLGYIRQSAQRLLSWMNEIIDVVSSSGEEINNDNPIYIDQLMEDLTELMRARIELKKLQWIVIVDPKIPKHLTGDLGGLRRVLLNLIGNSVKFTDEGSVTVELKLVSREGDDVVLDILVSDTGIGIPSDKYSEIFKKFSRLTSSYSGRYPGSGLGLYNISQIIERMGGSVKVESVVGKGSIFTCRLPLHVGETVAA